MSTTPSHPTALAACAHELAVWGCGPDAGTWAHEQMTEILARHWPAATPAPAPAPLPPGYLSLLLCLHAHGTARQVVNAYVNGQPLGVINAAGVFQPAFRSMPDGSKQTVRLRDVGEPLPFGSMDELRQFLHEVVDRLELPEPVAATPASADGS